MSNKHFIGVKAGGNEFKRFIGSESKAHKIFKDYWLVETFKTSQEADKRYLELTK